MKAKALPDRATLLALFLYDPETGLLYWKKSLGRSSAGERAGSADRKGYIIVGIDGERYPAHRIIWKMVAGHDPDADIDHRNGDKSCNRWFNLRPATRIQNSGNMRRRARKDDLPKGVKSRPSGRFQARVRTNGVCHHLGTFDTAIEAQQAYAAAARKLFNEFARTE